MDWQRAEDIKQYLLSSPHKSIAVSQTLSDLMPVHYTYLYKLKNQTELDAFIEESSALISW